MHVCNFRCDIETGSHYDVCYSANNETAEEYKAKAVYSYFRLGYRIVEVIKLLEWDSLQAAKRMATEKGMNAVGERVFIRCEPKNAYGIRIAPLEGFSQQS